MFLSDQLVSSPTTTKHLIWSLQLDESHGVEQSSRTFQDSVNAVVNLVSRAGGYEVDM